MDCIDRQSGGDGAKEGNFAQDGGSARAEIGGQQSAGFALKPTQRSLGGQGVEMAFDAEWTGQSEVSLDFAQRRRNSVFTVVGVDEIQHLLLAIGERFGHSVQVNTLSEECNSRN